MPPFVQFLTRRLIAILISLIIITMLLYAGVMMTPPSHACLALLSSRVHTLTEEQIAHAIQISIKNYHLDDPLHCPIFDLGEIPVAGNLGL